MTLVEHLKSDSDVVKLIFLSVVGVGLCIFILYLLAAKLGSLRGKNRGKPRYLQRPFIASTSNRISPTPKNGSPSFKLSPFNSSPTKWSPTFKPSKTPSRPTNKQLKYTPSPQPTKEQQQQQQTNHVSTNFLSQVILSINKTDTGRQSPPKGSKLNRHSPRDYCNPFILDTSTTDDSTLPSLVLSSEESTENISERTLNDDITPRIETTDIGVNTDENIHQMEKPTHKDSAMNVKRPSKPNRLRRDNFTSHLWSHKCPLPCVYEMRTLTSMPWDHDSHSDNTTPDGEHDGNGGDTHKKDYAHGSSTSSSDSGGDVNTHKHSFYGKSANQGRKSASNVFVQTEYSGDLSSALKSELVDSKMSPICSSDSTIKDNDPALHCCCGATNKYKNKKQMKQRRMKINSVLRSLESTLPEEIYILDDEASIMDKTSFVPPKSWYSLGSLCDEDEHCQTCGNNSKHDPHRNYHMRMYDSDTKLNLSGDAISYNDTGYTSTEEDNSSNNSGDVKRESSSCDHQDNNENCSYDGDYESDDEIFQVRLVGSEDMVYKPLPSISEPFGIEAYAAKEWTGDTPNAKAIREGYAAIPSQASCHQLRQIRGDNYCAIRAALFQALLNGIPVVDRLPRDGIPQVLRTILSSTNNVLQEWSFAGRISVEKSDTIATLEEFLTYFIHEAHSCQDIPSIESRTEHLLSLFNEETGNAEFKLFEAVKLLMLYNAVVLHNDINQGKDVPVLAWLLFARDTSPDPCALLQNHLNTVGDTGGLEQVEMCLLGYSLGVIIQVFRPSQVSKPDFIANYPYIEDMPPFSKTVSLVAEDDRHYNIIVE